MYIFIINFLINFNKRIPAINLMYPKLIIIVLLFLISLSFSNYTNEDDIANVSKSNKIEIHFFKGKKPIGYSTTNKTQVSFFKDLIAKGKNTPNLKCDTTGEIIYLKGKQRLLKIYFSTRQSGSKLSSGAMIYTINSTTITSGLTYNTGMFINEIFYRLNRD
jgi:hypothetical protein